MNECDVYDYDDEIITLSAMNVLARVSLSLPKEQRTLEMDEGIY